MKLKICLTVFITTSICGAIGFGVWWFMYRGKTSLFLHKGPNLAAAKNETNDTYSSSTNVKIEEHEADDIKLPWLAALMKTEGNEKKLLCGGALISKSHILAGKF